eukprot:snap_masked-scaffold_27-processed-gene-4.31-mRNA-1 protein AED:1.00 eAED:1.00 QI:0/0/0/0/1/1/2/0/59
MGRLTHDRRESSLKVLSAEEITFFGLLQAKNSFGVDTKPKAPMPRKHELVTLNIRKFNI